MVVVSDFRFGEKSAVSKWIIGGENKVTELKKFEEQEEREEHNYVSQLFLVKVISFR